MKELRKAGIYRLTHNLYIAVPAGRGRYFLYLCENGFASPPFYEIDEEGHVLTWPHHTQTGSAIGDLVDTGETHTLAPDFKCPQ